MRIPTKADTVSNLKQTNLLKICSFLLGQLVDKRTREPSTIGLQAKTRSLVIKLYVDTLTRN